MYVSYYSQQCLCFRKDGVVVVYHICFVFLLHFCKMSLIINGDDNVSSKRFMAVSYLVLLRCLAA